MFDRYKFHDDATVSYIDDTLRYCYTFKDVFLLVLAGNKAKSKTNAVLMQLIKM